MALEKNSWQVLYLALNSICSAKKFADPEQNYKLME